MANLSAKELTALEDQLGFEQLLVKKYRQIASSTDDCKLQTKCSEIASKHLEHYNTLLTHLN